MFRFTLSALLAMFGLACVLLPRADGQAELKRGGKADWMLLGPGPDVRPGVAYTLHNITAKQSLRYGKQVHGINLVWDESRALNNVRFHITPPKDFKTDKKDGKKPMIRDQRSVNYDTFVAIQISGGGWLGHRTLTAPLFSWRDEPFHYFFITGGKRGTPVQVGSPIALRSFKSEDFLIYRQAAKGIDLTWKDFSKEF